MALTNAGVNFIAQAVMGNGVPFNAANTHMGVGSSGNVFNVSQTDLQGSDKMRKAMDDGYPIIDGPKITFRSTFEASEANFPWNEWGIFNAQTGGVMLNRVVESNGTKQDNQTWILEVTVTFTT